VTFLRSSAKPFQALPFIESGGHERWNLTPREIAILCASHTGTDEHVSVLQEIQGKIEVTQADLLCGIHAPIDAPTREALRERGEEPTPNRHNCSGKHTGMLAHARLFNFPIADYINPEHPVQKRIL
ncbi:MAG: asparaginase, partial [Chloroflexi bacterium]|nr:asparaginase [Chloroflexota bacterium]